MEEGLPLNPFPHPCASVFIRGSSRSRLNRSQKRNHGWTRIDTDWGQCVGGNGAIRAGTAERMRKAVGFRNTAVHAYQELDWEVVHDIVTRRLGDFADFVREIEASVGEKGEREPPSYAKATEATRMDADSHG